MADAKPPARRALLVPTLFKDLTSSGELTPGRAWFGPEHRVLERNTRAVNGSAAYYRARETQADAYEALIQARIRIAKKFAELADLPAVIAEEQHQRDHGRNRAAHGRTMDNLRAAQELKATALQIELETAKLREQVVRTERNLQAARRVADVQVDQWYQQAAAARNEAEATRQDTHVDLHRAQPATSADVAAAAAGEELARTLAMIDHQIELEHERGNSSAVMALQNIKARLKSLRE